MILRELVFLCFVCAVFLPYDAKCAEVWTSLDGTTSVPDCNCKFKSVDYAVKHFISPILSNLTTKSFFRYFKVDLDSPCPFWSEAGQCMMEGCSVCTCEEDEIPKPWLETESGQKDEYGWIAAQNSGYGFEGHGMDDSLGRISVAEGESANLRLDSMYQDGISSITNNGMVEMEVGTANGILSETLEDDDDDDSDEWTVLNECRKKRKTHTATRNLPAFASAYGYGALFDPVDTAEEVVSDAAYVNLLENPERFTGYAGPSAQRVWRAIQEENCFGQASDVCLEKRIFYRLMSGMQASISTHIARNYLHPDGQWGANHPLYWRAVGDHPDRLNNLYFSFLFLLRAVVRAQDSIRHYPYHTGHQTEDAAVKESLERLLASSHPPRQASNATGSAATGGVSGRFYETAMEGSNDDGRSVLAESSLKELLRADTQNTAMEAVEECRYGFNEMDMFQVSPTLKGPHYWNTLEEKQELRDEFMIKFRNISRIMDCVTCEKCRVWGKLQILGIGTAIKILLHPAADHLVTPTATVATNDAHLGLDATSCDVLETKRSTRISLTRQEIIALMNTLNNFGNSLLFAAEAADVAQRQDVSQQEVVFGASWACAGLGAAEMGPCILRTQWKLWTIVAMGYLAPSLLLVAMCVRARGGKGSVGYSHYM